MLQITADMFSGRTNPTWIAGPEEARDLLQVISQNQPAITGVNEGYQGLGYRGLIVELLTDNLAEKYEVPNTFRIANNGNTGGLQIAERVFGAMRKADLLDKGLHSIVNTELQRLARREDASEPDHPEPPKFEIEKPRNKRAGVTCWIELGAFNPAFWNDPAHVNRNNCYNYASNRRTDTFAQPGRATGHQATTMACPNVVAAALSDGLHHRFDCFPDSEKPRWLMAMVVAPGYDYHWYRKQKEGFWGHKPGHTPARNVDNNGAIVWNPETAARLPYTDFCGYFYACRSQKIS